jgi:nitrite reductase (NADH) large subunit
MNETVGYVIIGNCIAAVGAVEGIRRHDRHTPITVLSKEPYAAYARPLIANYLKGKMTEEELALRSPDFYERNGVRLILGQPATGIRAQDRLVQVERGAIAPFQKLLIATGGIPILPPTPGLCGPDMYTFVTLDDARSLRQAAGRLRHMVVIGGGLIGLKAAESLHDLGIQVTIVELADRILSMAFDQVTSQIITQRLREIGIQIATGTTAAEVLRHRDQGINGVRLNDGTLLPCQAVVAAIGVAPQKALAEDTEIHTRRGILVNGFMETNILGIFAAGDVAESMDWHFAEWRVVPIWPNAYRQGMVAGRNMAGQHISFSGSIPMNSIAFYGIPTMSVGVTNPPEGAGYEVLVSLNEEERTYRKIVLKDGALVGAALLGRVERAGILTGLIREKRDVESFKKVLLKEDLCYLDLPRWLRKEKLGLPTGETPFGVRVEEAKTP